MCTDICKSTNLHCVGGMPPIHTACVTCVLTCVLIGTYWHALSCVLTLWLTRVTMMCLTCESRLPANMCAELCPDMLYTCVVIGRRLIPPILVKLVIENRASRYLCRALSCHHAGPGCATPCRAEPCHLPRHAAPCYPVPCYATPHYATPRRPVLCCAVLFHIMPQHAMLRHVKVCHAVPGCAVLRLLLITASI